MKTSSYNPSQIELEFAQAIKELHNDIQKKLKMHTIVEIQNNLKEDNPSLIFKLVDVDGDKHELVVKFIQRLEE